MSNVKPSRAPVIAGIGGALPAQVVTNSDIASRLDTTDEWIRSRTGITRRRRAESGISTGDLATEAARHALDSRAPGDTSAIDGVILATTTPDRRCPATAPAVAARLGLGTVPAFDVSAVCSGFVYALSVAAGLIGTGTMSTVLVIGSDTFSTIVDPDDRTTVAIFGDGAGAMVVRSGEDGENGALAGFDLGADGELEDLIIVRGGGSRDPHPADPADQWFTMAGQATYRHAVTRMSQSCLAVLAHAGWTIDTVGAVVPHQANSRILDTVALELDIDPGRVVSTIADTGNTAAASIPLALAIAAAEGRLTPGERVLLTAFGGGAAWGSAAMTWPAVGRVSNPLNTYATAATSG